MKKLLFAVLFLLVTTGSVFLAYIAGHNQGTIRADARSYSLERAVLDDFNRSGENDARKKLEELIKFRKKWQSAQLSCLDSWSYWRHVDAEGLTSK